MNLFDYFNKDVIIVDINGKKWHGYVVAFTPAIDSEDNIDDIDVMTIEQKPFLTSFTAPEIQSIEAI